MHYTSIFIKRHQSRFKWRYLRRCYGHNRLYLYYGSGDLDIIKTKLQLNSELLDHLGLFSKVVGITGPSWPI